MGDINWQGAGVTVDGVVERDFTIQGERDTITGVMWAPPSIPAGSPLVLIGHGGGGHKRAPSVVPTARGFVLEHQVPAVIIDAPGHGDRGGAQSRSPGYYALWADAQRMTGHAVADWQRVLTVLLDTGMFDPARVGWSGMSMGSLIGVPYVAAEPRLKAAALGLCGFTGVTPDQGGGGGVLRAAAPKITIPLIFMLQWDDERFDRQGSMEMFGAFGSADKRLVWHVGAHAEMPEEGRRHARAFLAGRLKA
jgi:dienelactone hydrolase